jgi:hypothetical protein
LVHGQGARVSQRAEIERLCNELEEALHILASAVAAAGGEIRIPRKLIVDPPKELSRWENPATHETVLRTQGAE